MSGILRLESLTNGNTLKQGDKTPLKYRLFDADGENLNIAGKSAKVRLVYPDFLTIGYEKDGLTIAQDDTVTFTIDSIIPSRIYHVEIIVDDKFIFPSRADEAKFTVDSSSLGTEANIIEIVGVDAVVRKAVDLINSDPNLIIDEWFDGELDKKANKQQAAWITPTLLNGWVEQASSQTPEYMKDEFGFVHFRGCITGGTAPLVFNLPEGYRPRATSRFPVTSGDGTIKSMTINSNMVQIQGTEGWYAYLDNVVYEARR